MTNFHCFICRSYLLLHTQTLSPLLPPPLLLSPVTLTEDADLQLHQLLPALPTPLLVKPVSPSLAATAAAITMYYCCHYCCHHRELSLCPPSPPYMSYSRVDHELDVRVKPENLLPLSDFKSKTSFEFLIEKYTRQVVVLS